MGKREWLTKDEAVAYLGVSERQVQRRAAEGLLQRKVLPREPRQKAATTLYNRADVEALKAGKPNQHAVVAPQRPQEATETAPLPVPSDFSREAFVALLQAQKPRPEFRPWLTLAEAAAYSGLPAGWIRRAGEAGEINAVNVGTEVRKSWRYHRDSLAEPGKVEAVAYAAKFRIA